MRAYISVDLEGMPFIVSVDHLSVGKPLYEEARKIATELVLVVSEILKEEGFEKVIVADSHGPMVNIKVEDLPEYVEIIRGFPRPTSMVVDVKEADVAMFLGYHARANTAEAVFDHTYSGAAIRYFKINDIEVSEYLLNTYYAGHFNVPVILVAGDSKLLEDVAKYTPWAERVEFKKSYSRYSAKSPSLKTLKNRIREAVRKAIAKYRRGEAKPLKLDSPIEMEVAFTLSGYADIASLLPGSKRLDGVTVAYKARDIVEAYKVLELWVLASAGVRSLITK
ncbi:MAG: peptide transporter [Thermoprotei archaeon]|nr:MAG: peptide transporter [Thermoprotei archaeon]